MAKTKWPTRPDGEPMSIGEMTPDQRRAVTRDACATFQRELRAKLPGIARLLANAATSDDDGAGREFEGDVHALVAEVVRPPVPREAIARAVRAMGLNRVEALALIQAAWGLSLKDARTVLMLVESKAF